MKKIILSLIAVFAFAFVMRSQISATTDMHKSVVAPAKSMTQPRVKKSGTSADHKANVANAASSVAKTATQTPAVATKSKSVGTTPANGSKNVPMKKDGTPDKRYTVNKTKVATHLRKDGEPDRRFKDNKTKQ